MNNGDVNFLPEIWPGPMEGIGREAFVNTVNALELTDRWMTPFFRISTSVPKKGKIRDFIAPFQNGEVPVCVQLMGTCCKLLGEVGAIFAEAGADSININLGCPSQRVCSGGAGGGALKHPELLAQLCCEVKAALPEKMELSVKLRTGWSDPQEMFYFLPELVSCGAVGKFFIHYRTVKELYSPTPLEYRKSRLVDAVKLCAGIPAVINGDIDSAQCAGQLLSETGASGVMSARPWMHDPFLLLRLKGREDLPDIAAGQDIFFAEAQKQQVPKGTLLELARLLWGVQSSRFQKLL